MNRFKQMTMNRFRLCLFTMFVVAVTAASPVIGVTHAEQEPAAAKQTDEQKAAAAKKAEAAARALAKRAEMLKQRQAAKEYIKKVIEGQQPGAAAPAPDNAGQGGAK